jgi:hypothetical protein
VRKTYESSGRDGMSATDKKIYGQWEELLGADRISNLPEAGRVVDVIFGILAREANKVDYFHKELKDRQRPDQVATVMKALETIHEIDEGKPAKLLKPGQSVTRRSGGKPSKSLA